MRVALGLITCERYEYTKRTLETFAEHNDLSRFMLLHGDDASVDDRVIPLVQSYGFKTIHYDERRGVMATQRLVADEALLYDCDWTLLLQNDWESVRAFPWDLFEWIAGDPTVYCLRMYGAQKDRGARVTGNQHKGKDGADAGWQSYNGMCEPAEIGSIHWGSPPAVTKTTLLWWLLEDAKRESDCRVKSGGLDLMTVRPVQNVMYHFGEERTPEFKR